MSDLLADLWRAGLILWQGMALAVSLIASRRGGARRPEVLIRDALQDLGMTGLKLGQFLALRRDLLPPEVCTELEKLFENVAPVSFETVREVIETDLGEPLTSLFSDFAHEPLAAASIAQIHLARNREGVLVAVKVQRPGLRRRFESDMRNLHRFARAADLLGVMNQVSLAEIVEEFAKFTSRELDFVIEGQTAERLRAVAAQGEIVPRIYWALSSPRVLTMEFIDGVSIAKVASLTADGKQAELLSLLPDLDIGKALHNLVFASVHQLYVVGFFHADPHPGNILICPGNRIAFVDFGIFGDVSPMQRENLTKHLEELIKGNIEQATRYYTRVYLPTERTDMRKLQKESNAVQRRWLDAVQSPNSSPGMQSLAKVSDALLTVVRQNYLRPTVDILLFVRGGVVMDATVRHLRPDFDLLTELKDFFASRRGVTEQVISLLSPEPLLPTLVELATTSASSLHEIMGGLVAGRFEMNVTLRDTPATAKQENRRAKRLVLTLLAVSVLMLARAASGAVVKREICAAAFVLLVLSLLPWKK